MSGVQWKVVELLGMPEKALFGEEWIIEVIVENAGVRSQKKLFFDNYEEAELYVNDFKGEYKDD